MLALAGADSPPTHPHPHCRYTEESRDWVTDAAGIQVRGRCRPSAAGVPAGRPRQAAAGHGARTRSAFTHPPTAPPAQVEGFVNKIENLLPNDKKAKRREDSLTSVRALGGHRQCRLYEPCSCGARAAVGARWRDARRLPGLQLDRPDGPAAPPVLHPLGHPQLTGDVEVHQGARGRAATASALRCAAWQTAPTSALRSQRPHAAAPHSRWPLLTRASSSSPTARRLPEPV